VKSVQPADQAFAALKEDGSVVVWGDPREGGDSASVTDELRSGVKSLFSSEGAFAALKEDGSVVSWGHLDASSLRQASASLKNGVVTIVANRNGFAALKQDGSVVQWGEYGPDYYKPAPELSSGVKALYNTGYSFTALKEDGSLFYWGDGWQLRRVTGYRLPCGRSTPISGRLLPSSKTAPS
jgi:hypothetical protein